MKFTQDELEKLQYNQLARLCQYYDIEIFKSWNKKKLIDAILEYTCNLEEVIPSKAVQRSVRIARINNSTKEV